MKNPSPSTVLLGVLIALSPIYAIHEDPMVIEDDFESVFYSVNSNIGRMVVWGGEVVNYQRSPGGTKLTIREIPLEYLGRDNGVRSSRGRFMVETRDSLSTDVFGLGMLCIVTGAVTGNVTLPLGEQQYTYPVLSAKAIYPCATKDAIALLRRPGDPNPIKIQGPFCDESGMKGNGFEANAPAQKSDMREMTTGGPAALANGYWTCTMDPEVHQEKSGACPRCGMRLMFHANSYDATKMRSAEH